MITQKKNYNTRNTIFFLFFFHNKSLDFIKECLMQLLKNKHQ